jgi:hypothetical protein
MNRLELIGMTFTSTPRRGFSVSSEVLNIILQYNNPTIQLLALYFETAMGFKLDEKIRKSSLDDMTKRLQFMLCGRHKISTYRDLLSLADVMCKPGREVDVAVFWIRLD